MSLMSTQIMSIDTRPTVRVRLPLTSTGVPLGAWRDSRRHSRSDDADRHLAYHVVREP